MKNSISQVIMTNDNDEKVTPALLIEVLNTFTTYAQIKINPDVKSTFYGILQANSSL